MKPTTIKLAAVALFYLSRDASNPCFDTGCFLGVCKHNTINIMCMFMIVYAYSATIMTATIMK